MVLMSRVVWQLQSSQKDFESWLLVGRNRLGDYISQSSLNQNDCKPKVRVLFVVTFLCTAFQYGLSTAEQWATTSLGHTSRLTPQLYHLPMVAKQEDKKKNFIQGQENVTLKSLQVKKKCHLFSRQNNFSLVVCNPSKAYYHFQATVLW